MVLSRGYYGITQHIQENFLSTKLLKADKDKKWKICFSREFDNEENEHWIKSVLRSSYNLETNSIEKLLKEVKNIK